MNEIGFTIFWVLVILIYFALKSNNNEEREWAKQRMEAYKKSPKGIEEQKIRQIIMEKNGFYE